MKTEVGDENRHKESDLPGARTRDRQLANPAALPIELTGQVYDKMCAF